MRQVALQPSPGSAFSSSQVSPAFTAPSDLVVQGAQPLFFLELVQISGLLRVQVEEALGGEQFALMEAVEELRRLRRNKDVAEWIVISAADPLNLAGLLDNGPRAPTQPRRRMVFKNGTAVASGGGQAVEWLAEVSPAEQGTVAALLSPETHRPDIQRARRRWRS